MSVPKLAVPQSKLDKLADDLKKLEVQTTVQVGGSVPIPAFQRQGYLEKLGHSRQKWFKRFFVLRDSFLLSYNLQKSDFTVEPRAAIHLGNSTIQLTEEANGKQFCFLITTVQRDKFLLAAESEAERQAWLADLEEARKVTHSNMIKLAVENQCLAEEKGAAQVARDNSTSPLTIFSNEEYIRNTPITGGAEGWLRTTGFNPDEQSKGLLGLSKATVTKCYFILRDSHLLMFHGGDILTKPRGAMYLLGTTVNENDEAQDEGFHFTVKSHQCGDEIGLIASSHKVRVRWMQALRIGARVTYPDYRLLLREHQLLSSVTMTPRAAPPKVVNKPAARLEVPPSPMLLEDYDIQGHQLDPGTQQAFDADGNPLIRTPEGKLVDSAGNATDPTLPRFGASGEQLDPFNRPLPPGAVPMFTADKVPIGVGPDGQHYLPDGTVVPESSAHFDADGNQLDADVVNAANAVSTNLNVAIKVRQILRGDEVGPEAVDVLGRTFRESKDSKSNPGTLVNADGEVVPLQSARRIETGTGKLVDYHPVENQNSGTHHLVIKADNHGDETEIGSVEVDQYMTLNDVRQQIFTEMEVSFPDFVFLINQVPLMKYEEKSKLAINCLPEVIVRGKELKPVPAPSNKFTKKIDALTEYEQQKKKEQEEFNDIMAQIRQGKFLKSAKNAL